MSGLEVSTVAPTASPSHADGFPKGTPPKQGEKPWLWSAFVWPLSSGKWGALQVHKGPGQAGTVQPEQENSWEGGGGKTSVEGVNDIERKP